MSGCQTHKGLLKHLHELSVCRVPVRLLLARLHRLQPRRHGLHQLLERARVHGGPCLWRGVHGRRPALTHRLYVAR
jgi:hypothetical protein